MLEPVPLPAKRPLLLDPRLLAIFSVSLIIVMGVSSIMPAFPAVTRALGITAQEVGWLIAVFTLPGIFLAPVWGVLADRWGRKRVLVPCLVLYAVAGSACALAPDFETLLVLRVVQGIGAAALGHLTFTLIADIFSAEERVAAVGYNVGLLSAAAAAYPVIGGALALFGWRFPFLLPAAALPIAIFAAYAIREPRREGAAESLKGFLVKFGGLIRDPGNATLYFCSLAMFVQLYGSVTTYLPFLLERNFATDSLDFGLIVLTLSVSGALASVSLGGIAKWVTHKTILLASFLTLSFPLALLPFVDSLWTVAVILTVIGAGRGMAEAVVYAMLLGRLPADARASAMALNSSVFRMGQTISPPIMGLFLVWGGMEAVYIGGALLAALPLPFIAAMRFTGGGRKKSD